MKRRLVVAAAAVFAPAALGYSLFMLFLAQGPGFSLYRHAFRLRLAWLIPLAVVSAGILVALWFFQARVVTRRYSVPYRDALRSDLISYLPLALLALVPMTLVRYINHDDIRERAIILLYAVLGAVLYLKVVQLFRLRRKAFGTRYPAYDEFAKLSQRTKAVGLFAGALVVLNFGAWTLLREGITFSGDEPHYLLMAHSLLHGGDLDLADNYENRDYRAYIQVPVKLDPHVVEGAKPGSRYSFHSPGTAFYLLPFYALGSLLGRTGLILLVRFGMSLVGALLVLHLYLFVLKETRDESAALWLYALALLTTPLYFYSIHVYPEIIVALLSFVAFRMLRDGDGLTRGKAVFAGLVLASFFWFHALKYIFIAVPLLVFGLRAFVRKRRRADETGLFLAAFATLTALYFIFQHALYGSASLSTVSWRGSLGAGETVDYLKWLATGIPLKFRWETLAGYFFDQKDGLFLYAPVWLFAFLGAAAMVRKRAKDLGWVLFIAAPYVLVSALLTQRAGYAPQARPLVAVFWVMPFLLVHFLKRPPRKVYAALFIGAAVASMLMTWLLLKHPLALYQETTQGSTERGGALFYLLSNLHIQVTRYLPSYTKSAEGTWWPNIAWFVLAALFIAGYFAARERKKDTRTATPLVFALAAVALIFVWLGMFPRPVLMNPTRVHYPSGVDLTFYSLSRVARQTDPGRFLLPQDGRSYIFTFQSLEPLADLRFDFGS
ncbi:MAG: hypothetical protein OEW05_11865, partial [Candidatus Aminicenantes bacterium]|nr:hypothetical protein [Candidatus Aminicenantes bacterium]